MKSDADLMLAFKAGDTGAFEKLVLRHQIGLFNFFMRMSNKRDLAEDLTQDVFFRVYLHADTYESTAKFTTYLYRIARNCWIDHIRRLKRRGRPKSLDEETAEDLSLRSTLPAATEPPSARMEREEQGRVIEEALAGLPEEQRMVFILSEMEGLKYAEIAEALEIPVGTVKSRMHVAVRRLRDQLVKRGYV